MCDVSDNVPPETVANYLHAAIEADRTFYTIHVVEPLQKSGAVAAAENRRAKKNVLPLPVQLLMESSALSAMTGTPVRATASSVSGRSIRSMRHGVQQKRLVWSRCSRTRNGSRPERSRKGNETYFQAIYTDRAVSQTCVRCHNIHP